jgi:hypothetical protein
MSPICRRRVSTSHAQAFNALETTLLLWHNVPCHAAHDALDAPARRHGESIAKHRHYSFTG